MSILEVSGLKKIYTTRFGSNKVEALRNVTFSVEEGEYVSIMGESGSGKTTLLNILAALDKPTAGSVKLCQMELTLIKEAAVAAFRRDNLGFVFQDFNLLDTFTLEDNIYLPLVLAGKSYDEMHKKTAAHSKTAGNRRPFEKVSLRGIGRSKAASRRCTRAYYKPRRYTCRRADRRARLALYRRAFYSFSAKSIKTGRPY